MSKSEARGNGTQASVHLVLQGKAGVSKSFVLSILGQYFHRSISTTITQPESNDLSRVEALSYDALYVLLTRKIQLEVSGEPMDITSLAKALRMRVIRGQSDSVPLKNRSTSQRGPKLGK